jgi:hypothetical protein
MKSSRKEIVDFLTSYWRDYYEIGQNPENLIQMYRYFTPECQITQYLYKHVTIFRDEFLMSLPAHPNVKEELIPIDIIVDEERGIAVALLKGRFTKIDSGEVVTIMFSAHYHLGLDEENKLKIKHLHIFGEGMPRGKSVPELFGMEEIFGLE